MEVNKLVKSKEILNKKMMSLETSKLTLEHEITKNKYIYLIEKLILLTLRKKQNLKFIIF